jgi:hypothetical protein
VPFQDLTNLSQHTGMQALRTTRSESKDESLLLRRQLDSKNQALLQLRKQLDNKSQELVDIHRHHQKTQEYMIKGTKRQAFKHRLYSMSLMSTEVGSEVLVEAFGYGIVESTTFSYSSESAFWSLVSGADSCSLTIKLNDTTETLVIKLGTLERNGHPTGYVI